MYIEWVLGNVLEFCDHIIVLDNLSTDHTWDILEHLAETTDKISVERWENANDSQKALAPYYGTNTWIFGVDGDEVYDPVGLASLRKRLLSGEFNDAWRLRGDFLNCTRIDLKARTADGYLSSEHWGEATKLYNYRMVMGLASEEVERLHGTPIWSVSRPVSHPYLGNTWEESALRCLHLCFMQRSSSEPRSPVTELKRRIFQKLPTGSLAAKSKWMHWMKPLGHRIGPNRSIRSNTRRRLRQYAAGELVTVDIARFNPPPDREGGVAP